MKLPAYEGFKSGRERNQYVRELIEAFEACEGLEELEELLPEKEVIIRRLKAELKENLQHWIDYEELLNEAYNKHFYYLQQKEEFTLCY